MKININNLGNLKQGTFDISKKLTLFCGPNNTGKTYVSYIVYALLKGRILIDVTNSIDLSDFIQNGRFSFELNRNNLLNYRKTRIEEVVSNMESIFGISESDKESLFSDLNVSYGLTDDEFINKVIDEELDYVFKWDGLDVRAMKGKGTLAVTIQKESPKAVAAIDSFFLELQMMDDICEQLVNYPYANACIFPVERNSIYTFNKELSIQRNELIEQMQALKDNRKLGHESVDKLLGRSTRYPLAIRDCLAVANDLNNLQKNKSAYYAFAEELEQRLLGGKIVVTKNGDVQFVPKAGQKLPVHLSASIVKTLSSLTFYLKHLAKKGDLIIIDEPEMNLHPDAQVLLTRVFARLINSDLNLLMSTHSDYIIRELNNLISLGSMKNKDSILKELGYDEKECIKYDDVSVYLFKPLRKNSKATQISPVPVKRDGFSIETIDEVIYQSNVESDTISYHLEYGDRD